MPTLSVIIPVYNTKKYLSQCIDSIMNQSYVDMEIIIVNDGSTDGAGSICDQYKTVDSRIKVIHQENKGLVFARYTGVINARGEYIGFVDSDDWIAGDMYEDLMTTAKIENSDIVSMGYTGVSESGMQEEDDATLFGKYEEGKNMDIVRSRMMFDIRNHRRGVHPSLCCKVIKRELLLDAITKVDKSISIGEDAAVFYPCCLKAKSICIIKKYKYYYRFHEKSMCHSFNTDTFEKIKIFDQYMKTSFSEFGDKYHLFEQLKMYIWDFINFTLKQVFGFYACAYTAEIFPRNVAEKGSDIVLYGAGRVGKSYHKQIIDSNYCNIVAWVDKDKYGTGNIINPVEIKNKNFSKVVIAVLRKEMAEEIEQELIELGIPKEKIAWEEPQNPPQVFFRMV